MSVPLGQHQTEIERNLDAWRNKPLLREMLDTTFESDDHRKFRVNRSLRDVEPDVNLFLKDLSGMKVEDRS